MTKKWEKGDAVVLSNTTASTILHSLYHTGVIVFIYCVKWHLFTTVIINNSNSIKIFIVMSTPLIDSGLGYIIGDLLSDSTNEKTR